MRHASNLQALLALAALAAAPARPQTPAAVVPDPAARTLAPTFTAFLGEPRQRVQLVVSRSHLQPLGGRAIAAVEFRHLNEAALPIRAGHLHLRAVLSTAARPPLGAATAFAANHGPDRAVLFDRDVAFADGSALGGSQPTPWGDARNLRLVLDRPFPCPGDLCLELESWGLPDRKLPVWFAEGAIPAGLPATGTPFGQATTGADPLFAPFLYGRTGPGETFALDLEGVGAGLPAFLVLGLSRTSWWGLPLPLPVGRSAGQEVLLRVSLDLALPVLAAQVPGPPILAGRGWATLAFPMPWEPSLAGARLYAQWFSLVDLLPDSKPDLHLAATAGLELQLSGTRSHLDLAWLQAEGPDAGGTLPLATHTTVRFSPCFRLEGTP